MGNRRSGARYFFISFSIDKVRADRVSEKTAPSMR
jgi:hypothetical protein